MHARQLRPCIIAGAVLWLVRMLMRLLHCIGSLQAEEEAIRASAAGPRSQLQQQQQAAARARVRPQLILDEQAVKEAVLRIGAVA